MRSTVGTQVTPPGTIDAGRGRLAAEDGHHLVRQAAHAQRLKVVLDGADIEVSVTDVIGVVARAGTAPRGGAICSPAPP